MSFCSCNLSITRSLRLFQSHPHLPHKSHFWMFCLMRGSSWCNDLSGLWMVAVYCKSMSESELLDSCCAKLNWHIWSPNIRFSSWKPAFINLYLIYMSAWRAWDPWDLDRRRLPLPELGLWMVVCQGILEGVSGRTGHFVTSITFLEVFLLRL